ncbi:MAG: hypothetical protein MHM6MM_009517, partial [Cercozoa sp. M6MM]
MFQHVEVEESGGSERTSLDRTAAGLDRMDRDRDRMDVDRDRRDMDMDRMDRDRTRRLSLASQQTEVLLDEETAATLEEALGAVEDMLRLLEAAGRQALRGDSARTTHMVQALAQPMQTICGAREQLEALATALADALVAAQLALAPRGTAAADPTTTTTTITTRASVADHDLAMALQLVLFDAHFERSLGMQMHETEEGTETEQSHLSRAWILRDYVLRNLSARAAIEVATQGQDMQQLLCGGRAERDLGVVARIAAIGRCVVAV